MSSPAPAIVASAVSDTCDLTQPVPPPHFCCPITLQLMKEPVIAPDGNSYDLEALRQWAQACPHNPPTLPTTGLPFDVSALVKNLALRDAIAQWRAQHGIDAAPVEPNGAAIAAAVAAATPAPRPAVVIPPTRYFASPNKDAFIAVPPATGPKRSLHVCIVVDVSGSMQSAATMRDQTGEKAEMANSVLDIVKYAAKAVAHMLGPDDSFSLVKFSNTAQAVLTCRPTNNDAAIESIDEAIGRLGTEGATNLGDGLRCALQLVADNFQKDPSRLNAIMMLTDGQPNEGPVATSVLGSFRRSPKVIAAVGAHPATTVGEVITKHTIVNTFAFGYSHRANDICSSLMFDVAALGNGVYGYIPDIGFLGTQFIHCLANLRATASVATTAIGPDAPNETGLWTVQYGAFGISCKNVASIDAVDFSRTVNVGPDGALVAGLAGLTEEEVAAVKAALPAARAGYKVSKALLTILRGPITECTYNKNGEREDEGARMIDPKYTTGDSGKDAVAAALTTAAGSLDDLPGLAEDISSQVAVAFSAGYYARWGLHYVYSWLSAQQHRVCNNFKDKSLAVHKTPFVKAIHDTYDDIFNMMAPPEPTQPMHRYSSQYGGGGGGGLTRASASMTPGAAMAAPSRRAIQSSRQINSSYNPCVHEDTHIAMADGTTRPARLVRSGDTVHGGLVIDRVIRTQTSAGSIQLVSFPPVGDISDRTDDASDDGAAFAVTVRPHGLRITPWHPVLVCNTPSQLGRGSYVEGTLEWMMPLNTGYPVGDHACAHVYSFTVVPSDGTAKRAPPVIVAEGVSMVYLGHGYDATTANAAFPNDSVLTHAFFGTAAVTAQLAAAHPTHRHHEFAHAPVVKADRGDGKGLVAVGWDMSKYVGTW